MPFSVLETLAEGSGPTAKCGDKCVVHYVGWLAKTMAKFDDSRDRGHAMTVPVGLGKVIKGWDDVLATMRQGDRLKVLIPSDEAYGPKGRPPSIPPASDLIFDVELIALNETLVAEGLRIKREEAARADRFLRMQDEERAAEAGGAERGARKRGRGDDGSASESGSESGSGGSSSSSSSSESSEARRRRKKRKKERKARRERKREKRRREKKEKKEKKAKKEKKEKKKSKKNSS